MGFSYEMNMLLSCRESPTLSLLEEWERVLGERRERSDRSERESERGKVSTGACRSKIKWEKERGGREGM